MESPGGSKHSTIMALGPKTIADMFFSALIPQWHYIWTLWVLRVFLWALVVIPFDFGGVCLMGPDMACLDVQVRGLYRAQ